ncbi:MAG: GPW/gp25 family protein [Polyangiaceae bacterium]
MSKLIPLDRHGASLNFPLEIDGGGRLRTVGYAEHVAQMIEQALLTALGERVNLPTFGSGLLERVFEGSDTALVASTRTEVIRALQQGLGAIITVVAVTVTSESEALRVSVTYAIADTPTTETVTLQL